MKLPGHLKDMECWGRSGLDARILIVWFKGTAQLCFIWEISIMNAFSFTSFAFCALVSLASCGGGGGPALSLDPQDVQDITGGSAPGETAVTEQEERSETIAAQFNSLFATNMHYQTSLPQLPRFVAETSCRTTYCTVSFPALGFSDVISIESLRSSEFSGTETAQSILTKFGVTLVESAWVDAPDESGNAVAGTLDHSEFGSATNVLLLDGERISGRFAAAFGVLADEAPSISGVWRGQMSAVTQNSGNFLQGDAALVYTVSGSRGELSASFTNIKNLSRNIAHSTSSVRFRNVPVSSGGIYSQGTIGNRIEGAFYGSGGVETAGIFEKSEILASFGAIRSQ